MGQLASQCFNESQKAIGPNISAADPGMGGESADSKREPPSD